MESATTNGSCQPNIRLTYPLPGDEAGGCLFVFGNRNASKLVFASGGFPDDHQVLAAVAATLAAHHDCLVGVVCVPGTDDRPERPWQSHPRDGFRLSQITNIYHEAVKVLRSHSTNSQAKMVYLLHDWGSFFGLQLANRNLDSEGTSTQRLYAPYRIVILDLIFGPHPSQRAELPKKLPRPPLVRFVYLKVVEVFYRVMFALCYIGFYYLGSKAAAAWFKLCSAVAIPLQLSPGSPEDNAYVTQKNLEHVTYMCYLYYYLCKSIITLNAKEFDGMHMPPLELVPVLFLYGSRKNANFHPESTVAVLENDMQRGGASRVVAVENAGHWIHLQQPEVCMKEIGRFIDELKVVGQTTRDRKHKPLEEG